MQYTKHTLKKEIFTFVIAAHAVLLALLFFCDKGDFEQEKFLIKTNSLAATVVFMPLHKRVPAQSVKSASTDTQKSRRVMSHDAYQKALDRKKAVKKAVKKPPAPKKPIVSKPVVKTVTTEKKSVTSKADVKSPTTLRQEKVKAIVEKNKPKTVKQAVKAVAKKAEVKSIVDKKHEKKIATKEVKQPEKIQEVTPVEPAKVEEAKISEPLKIDEVVASDVQEVSTVEDEEDDDIDLDNVSFVGRYDLEKYEIEEKIKTEIAKHWKSPIGIAKTVTCELGIVVGLDGKVLQVTIKKGSGSLVYDMSAKAAAYQSRFPKEVCGKEFTIVLGA